MLRFPLRESIALAAIIQPARHPASEPLIQFSLPCKAFAVLSPPTSRALLPSSGFWASFAPRSFDGFSVAEAVAMAAMFVPVVPGTDGFNQSFV
jgi:hypothetical protein